MKIRKATSRVTGLGTCFLPAINAMPKEFLTIDYTLLSRPMVDEAVFGDPFALKDWRFDCGSVA